MSLVRKYSGSPYEVHTIEVASIVAGVTDDENLIAAAHLHDTAEDVNIDPYTLEGIELKFGPIIRQHVEDLTAVYTKKAFPHLDRAARKGLEAERLSKIQPGSQTVKLADIISNTQDVVQNDPTFAMTYLNEKRDLLPFLIEGDSSLWAQADAILRNGLSQLSAKLLEQSA